jgi:hypothetical protein
MEKIMEYELAIPHYLFHFNGVNVITQTPVVSGPWTCTITGRTFQVSLVINNLFVIKNYNYVAFIIKI